MTNSRHRRTTAVLGALVGIPLLFALTACAPSAPSPRPTGTSTPSALEESESPTPTPAPEETVDAATVVVTASGISVFGTDGSTLVAATYRGDGATVAAQVAEALGEDPTVTITDGSEAGSCPARTIYTFGALEIGTPGGIGSAGFMGSGDKYDAFVTGSATAGGVAIETVAGQRIGSTRAAFEAAVGDEMLLDEYGGSSAFGFDIVNPEAGLYDHIGVQAWFDEGVMTGMSAPAVIGFVGDCS